MHTHSRGIFVVLRSCAGYFLGMKCLLSSVSLHRYCGKLSTKHLLYNAYSILPHSVSHLSNTRGRDTEKRRVLSLCWRAQQGAEGRGAGKVALSCGIEGNEADTSHSIPPPSSGSTVTKLPRFYNQHQN